MRVVLENEETKEKRVVWTNKALRKILEEFEDIASEKIHTREQQSGISLSYKSKYLGLDPSKPTTEKPTNTFLFVSMVESNSMVESTSMAPASKNIEEILSNKYLGCHCRSKENFSKSHPENIFVESILSKMFERSHDTSYVWRMLASSHTVSS
ncbi:hypothetical protein ACOMHN_030490 [Nucella lapillus]